MRVTYKLLEQTEVIAMFDLKGLLELFQAFFELIEFLAELFKLLI